VTARNIDIVHEDNDMIVINKPAGVPVHPSGRYKYNSVTEIMRAERGYEWNPLPCNRLDRLTSGIMFIGKHKKAADDMSVQIMARTVKKEYIARVIGEFPDGGRVRAANAANQSKAWIERSTGEWKGGQDCL